MFLSMSMTNGTAGQKAIAMVICFILLINVKLWIIISSIFIQLVLTCVNCREAPLWHILRHNLMFLSMSMTNGTARQKAIAMVICFILLTNVTLLLEKI